MEVLLQFCASLSVVGRSVIILKGQVRFHVPIRAFVSHNEFQTKIAQVFFTQRNPVRELDSDQARPFVCHHVLEFWRENSWHCRRDNSKFGTVKTKQRTPQAMKASKSHMMIFVWIKITNSCMECRVL